MAVARETSAHDAALRYLPWMGPSTATRMGAKSSANTWITNTLLAMLTPQDRTLLDFERCSINMAGPKDWSIENVLGLSAASYYLRLRDLVSDPDARAYDPMTVRRVLELIEEPLYVEAAVS